MMGVLQASSTHDQQGTSEMKVSHTPAAVSAAFDDPKLIAHAGLVPVMRLAERCGLARLVAEKVRLTGAKNGAGAGPDAKVTSIVAGMAAGADSIDDLHVLRHGAMPVLFADVRAPSTLGSFLRAFTHGHALQLHAVHRRFLAALAAHTPLLPGAGEKAFIDVDSTHKRVYGRTKQGAEYGRFKGVRTLHPLLATICTPASRPGDRHRADAPRQGSRLPRRPEVPQRGPGHRRRGRPHRPAHAAGRLAVLQRRCHHRLPPGRRPLLDHHRHEPLHQTRSPRHSRRSMAADHLPDRGARPRDRRTHLGRRSRRDAPVHCLREPEESGAGHRPADRPPGP